MIEQGARDFTVVNNNAGNGDSGLAALLKAGRVRKIICSSPRQADSQVFDALYRMAARNFGPVMATAARRTVASVYEIVELGTLAPEAVVTPGLFVNRIVRVDRMATQADSFAMMRGGHIDICVLGAFQVSTPGRPCERENG